MELRWSLRFSTATRLTAAHTATFQPDFMEPRSGCNLFARMRFIRLRYARERKAGRKLVHGLSRLAVVTVENEVSGQQQHERIFSSIVQVSKRNIAQITLYAVEGGEPTRRGGLFCAGHLYENFVKGCDQAGDSLLGKPGIEAGLCRTDRRSCRLGDQ